MTKRLTFAQALYRDDPTPRHLTWIIGDLNRPGGEPDAPEFTRAWLGRHGEDLAQASADAVRAGCRQTAMDLHTLRLQLNGMGVPCDRWAVSAAEISQALRACALADYRQAVQGDSSCHGWRVLQLWGGGFIENPDTLAPGARDVVVAHSIRHIAAELREASGPGRTARWMLDDLRPALAGLDAAAREEFRRAGVPADDAAVDRARNADSARRHWSRFRGRLDLDAGEVGLFAIAFRHVLARKTVTAEEIGTTEHAMWSAAAAVVAALARQARAGDVDAFDRLSTFAAGSELGYDSFGIAGAQVDAWRHAQARQQWERALAGDGWSALLFICGREDGHGSYEQLTGLPAADARAALQESMERYAAGLRRRIVTAFRRELAEEAFASLDDFIHLAEEINELADRAGRARPVDTAPWVISEEDWTEMFARYVR